MKRLESMNWCQIVQGILWALQNLMKQAKFVAYEQDVIVCIFLLNFVMSFASAADHQASSAIVSKQTLCVKNLYTITFCSYATNFACFIKFWIAHHIPCSIWHIFLGYRGISILRGKIVAISIVVSLFTNLMFFLNEMVQRNAHKCVINIKWMCTYVPKIYQIWSISVEVFIKQKLFISEDLY